MGKGQKTEKEFTLKGSALWGALVFGILLLVDMLTKIVADSYFSSENTPDIVKLIPGYLELRISYNRGIAFSIGDDSSIYAKVGLIAATCVMFVALTVYYLKMDKRRSWIRWALVLVIAGGIGNLIDRVYYQVWDESTFPAGVRDMVYVKILFLDFGVCNFADFFIVGGAIMLMAGMIFFDAAAICPLTKKYKALAKEYEAKETEKQAKKKGKAETQEVQKE